MSRPFFRRHRSSEGAPPAPPFLPLQLRWTPSSSLPPSPCSRPPPGSEATEHLAPDPDRGEPSNHRATGPPSKSSSSPQDQLNECHYRNCKKSTLTLTTLLLPT